MLRRLEPPLLTIKPGLDVVPDHCWPRLVNMAPMRAVIREEELHLARQPR